MLNKAIAVKAVLIVSTLPIQTYTENEMTETKIGALIQSAKNMIMFNRAEGRKAIEKVLFESSDIPFTIHFISFSRASKAR